jgi:selenocysteine lyase/cysteine desulfurase
VRPSLALYNTRDEIDVLTAALHRIRTGYGAGRI